MFFCFKLLCYCPLYCDLVRIKIMVDLGSANERQLAAIDAIGSNAGRIVAVRDVGEGRISWPALVRSSGLDRGWTWSGRVLSICPACMRRECRGDWRLRAT